MFLQKQFFLIFALCIYLEGHQQAGGGRSCFALLFIASVAKWRFLESDCSMASRRAMVV
jgi:hypothetical protein